MEDRAPSASLATWSELRLDLDPTIKSSIVQIRLPDRSTFSRTPRGSRRVLNAYPECKSEEQYAKIRAASAASVSFRPEGRFPRNILWRCLGDKSILELRAVDLCRPEGDRTAADTPTILQFGFPSAIQHGCVGFAEAEHGDSFEAFVLTESKDLYTLTVPSSWFTTPEKSDDDPDRWCRSSRPTTLAVGQVLKLTSALSRELLFSMTDGRTVRLTRQENANGSAWSESAYSDNQWSAFRGLIPWQGSNNIKYEGQSLDPSTSLAVLPSPDEKNLISVTLSHTLKVWDVQTGKPVFEQDLLGIEQDPNQPSKLTLDPGQKQVLAIDPNIRSPDWSSIGSDPSYCVFTYSPHHGGSFKVWTVRDANGGNIEDVFPDQTLRAPDPDDNAVWTLADFQIGAQRDGTGFSFWIMLRLNRRYKIYHKSFASIHDLGTAWGEDWDQTYIPDSINAIIGTGTLVTTPAEPLSLAFDPVDDLSWLTSTDAVSTVRKSSDMEQLVQNRPWHLALHRDNLVVSLEGGEGASARAQAPRQDCATLIQTSLQFRANIGGFPIDDALRSELWQDASYPPAQRISAFFDRASLSQVPDRVFNDLEESLRAVMDDDSFDQILFSTILSKLPSRLERDERKARRSHTAFGRKALVTGAQEMLRIHERVVSSLLYTLVFVTEDLDRQKYPLAALYPEQVFESLVQHLRHIQVACWLASKTRSKQGRDMTILDDYRTSEIQFQSFTHQSASTALTGTVADLLVWSVGSESSGPPLDDIIPAIHCNLIVNGDLGLANDFLRFLPSNAWATYVRARHALCIEDCAAASVYFKKAAYQCSRPSADASHLVDKSSNLLGPLEAGHFGHGLANYYTHVVELFSSSTIQAHAQVVTFASLALQYTKAYDHPGKAAQQRSDLLARLFHAALALGDYDEAVSAVSRYTDKALRKASLKELVANAVLSGAVHELLGLPYSESMKTDVDTILSARTRGEHLNETEQASAVKILFAWRVKYGDYRGAAACLVEKLQTRRPAGTARRPRIKSGSNKDGILDDYLISINALALLGKMEGVEESDSEGWLLVDKGEADGPRSLVRLKDLRREYQQEIDRRERWEKGQFALTGAGDDEDDDGDAIMAT